MSQLSIQQQVKGIVSRANFADPEINKLVDDVTQLDIDAVIQQAEILQQRKTEAPRDAQNAILVVSSIERLKMIHQQSQNTDTERDARHRALIDRPHLRREHLK